MEFKGTKGKWKKSKNAKLIAAAPEMFEVLKEVLKKMPLGACPEELQEIKQLLTKITE